jgi:hypothetical protein
MNLVLGLRFLWSLCNDTAENVEVGIKHKTISVGSFVL